MQRTSIIAYCCSRFHAVKALRKHGYSGEIHKYNNT